MPPSSEEFSPSPGAPAVADALRSGLAVRRVQLDEGDSDSGGARLRALGDLEGLPPAAKPGPAAVLVRRLRQVLQVLRRWWPLLAYTIVEIVIPWYFLSTAEERLPDYPDLPTLKEHGYPELVATTWFSISAPGRRADSSCRAGVFLSR